MFEERQLTIPYRMALAGGWIDQPFISELDPAPPGSMVVVALEPEFRFMDRCGMGTSTRKVAMRLWGGRLPDGDPAQLVRTLYAAENEGRSDPSGSQDMAGLVYPGISRLDYDSAHEGGRFPVRVESCNDPEVTHWLETVMHILPVAPRPEGYGPLGEKRLEPKWIRRLGQSGKDCYDAILAMDTRTLGESMNECMRCWEALLPNTVRHPSLSVDLTGILADYQARYDGAMYSGCGGGYLYVVSHGQVPGSTGMKIREISGRRRAPGKKVVVTGCFDWFHSGHVRFFEEVSRLGDLYVVVGSDVNVRLLKGEGHPMFPQEERRYIVQAIRYVKKAFVSSGHGWVDAEPEIELIRPDIYVVNEDGDNIEKREFCRAHGIEYVVLRRIPREGLPPRSSTELRERRSTNDE